MGREEEEAIQIARRSGSAESATSEGGEVRCAGAEAVRREGRRTRERKKGTAVVWAGGSSGRARPPPPRERGVEGER